MCLIVTRDDAHSYMCFVLIKRILGILTKLANKLKYTGYIKKHFYNTYIPTANIRHML